MYRCDAGHGDGSILVLLRPRLSDGPCPLGNRLLCNKDAHKHSRQPSPRRYIYLKDARGVIYGECHVAHPVAVFGNVCIHLHLARIQRRLKDKENPILTDDMRDDVAMIRLQSAIGDTLKAKARAVKGRCLLGIPDPKDHMVKSVILSNLRTRPLVCVARLSRKK